MFSKRSIVTTAGLIILVGITNYISLKSVRDHGASDKGLHITGIADDIHVTQMTKTGTVDYTAHANKAIRYSDGRSRLYQVKATDFEPGQAPWQLSADNGWSYSGGQKLHLWDNVLIWRDKMGPQRPVRFSSSELTYYPHKDLASTPAPVRISEPGTSTVTTAIGMVAHPKTKTVKLLSKVHSIYESPLSMRPTSDK